MTENVHTVSFDSQGGSAVAPTTVTHGNTAARPGNPARNGYIFDGWYRESGCMTAWNFDTDTVTGDLTLYAKWTKAAPPAPTTHTVSFDSQGGSAVAPATVAHGGKIAKPADPAKNGYIFDGWHRESGCTTAWNFDTDTVDENLTLYAKWTLNGGGGPSGGSSSSGGSSYAPTTYPPTVKPGAGGSVSVTPGRPKRGDTVTIKPEPDTGYEIESVTVTDRNGKAIQVERRDDGTYAFTQPGGKVEVEVVFKPAGPSWVNPYPDVAEGVWYYDAVRFANESGLMQGYDNGRFGPDDDLSRAQLAQILFNREGRPTFDHPTRYGDVSDGSWYAEAVHWAAVQGIAGGYGNGNFGPDDPITREQLAVMLWRYSGNPAATNKELHFNDTDEADSYALEALRWAVEKGILSGYGDGRLGPKGLATRAQVAQVLKNLLGSREDVD